VVDPLRRRKSSDTKTSLSDATSTAIVHDASTTGRRDGLVVITPFALVLAWPAFESTHDSRAKDVVALSSAAGSSWTHLVFRPAALRTVVEALRSRSVRLVGHGVAHRLDPETFAMNAAAMVVLRRQRMPLLDGAPRGLRFLVSRPRGSRSACRDEPPFTS